MNGKYIHALEMQAKWLAWVNDEKELKRMYGEVFEKDAKAATEAVPVYRYVLDNADTFFMNEQFCDLVDHARSALPLDLKFECSWMQSEIGFVWLEKPFSIPQIGSQELRDFSERTGKKMVISAFGWIRVSAKDADGVDRTGYHIVTFFDFSYYKPLSKGFGCWSYFTLMDGVPVGARIGQFEKIRGDESYYRDLAGYVVQEQHEIRYVYTALHLMAQKMTHHSIVQTAKHVVKQGIQNSKPVNPQLRIISLRRLEDDRERASKGGFKNWHWQWTVRGHWRKQSYGPGRHEYKQIFVEAYIKGPEGKPLKPVGKKLFLAVR